MKIEPNNTHIHQFQYLFHPSMTGHRMVSADAGIRVCHVSASTVPARGAEKRGKVQNFE